MRQKTKKMNYTIYKCAIALVNSWRNGKKKIHQEKRDEENANINTNNGMNFMNEEIFSLNAQLCNTAFCRKENWGKKAETHILLQKNSHSWKPRTPIMSEGRYKERKSISRKVRRLK